MASSWNWPNIPKRMTPDALIPTVAANCSGCGACVSICPQRALSLTGDTPGQRGHKRAVVDAQRCNGCSQCVPACPRGALTLATPVVAGNLLEALPACLPDELVETLCCSEHVRIERIVSRGHTSAEGFWYDQVEHEFVLLVSGGARLAFADEAVPVEMTAGAWLVIPAHKKHRVEWTDPERDTVWLAVHFTAPTAEDVS